MKCNTYQEMKSVCKEQVARVTDHFVIEDMGSSYVLSHQRLPLDIKLPIALERRATSQLNMMPSLSEEESPESMINILRGFTNRRNVLLQRGYPAFERFEWCEDGLELVYYIFSDARMVRDFDEVRE